MNLILLGINHKTAPIELRERVAIPRERIADFSRQLTAATGIRESRDVSVPVQRGRDTERHEYTAYQQSRW